MGALISQENSHRREKDDKEKNVQLKQAKYISKSSCTLRRAASLNIYLTSALNILGWQ